MKKSFQLILLLLLNNSCQSQEQKLNIKYENIDINIAGTPGPWIKHNNEFYCYFMTDNDKYSSESTNHFYILDDKGYIKSKITVPEKLQTFYFDLYIKNDTIFTTDYYDQNTFYLDKNEWRETKKAVDLFYEDENYSVYSLDFGEWGNTTWFEDKMTNKQYEFSASSPIINRLEDTYYVTLENRILKIENPKHLELSKQPYDYKKEIIKRYYTVNASTSLKGTETIYEFKTDAFFDQKFSFATSFILNKKLYHLYKDSISTKIGIVDNKRITTIYDFTEKIIPIRFHYNWRNQIQNNNYQTIQFLTKNKNEFGIIEINVNNILVSTFKNSFQEIELGEAAMKRWFEEYFDYYFSNFDNLALKEIDSIEQKEKATNITQKHKISTYLLDSKKIETPRIYRKIESKEVQLNTLYYYNVNDKSVELIEFEWGKNKKEHENIEDALLDMMNENKKTVPWKQKYDWVSNYLTKKIGKASSSNEQDNKGSKEWKIGNKIISLKFDVYVLELTMFKK